MVTTSLQVLGLLVSIAGWVGGALVCAAPFWRVSAFVADELVVSEVKWEGLWMTCLAQLGKVQCKVYDSTLALSSSAQFCRVLAVLSLLLGLLALPVGVVGLKCTHCLGDSRHTKGRLVSVAGLIFIVAGVFFFLPVCWTAITVIRDFYDPNVAPPLKRELGPALYMGWSVALLMVLGGTLLYRGGSTLRGVFTKPAAVGGATATKNNPSTGAEGKQEKAYV